MNNKFVYFVSVIFALTQNLFNFLLKFFKKTLREKREKDEIDSFYRNFTGKGAYEQCMFTLFALKFVFIFIPLLIIFFIFLPLFLLTFLYTKLYKYISKKYILHFSILFVILFLMILFFSTYLCIVFFNM